MAGDWDGDGDDTVGVYHPSTGTFFLRNSNAGGSADVVVSYGPGGSNIVPLSGDWDGDGDDTVGIYDSSTGFFFLKNANTPGAADLTFSFVTSIEGYVELLLDRAAGRMDDEARESLAVVKRSADRLLGLINDLLDSRGSRPAGSSCADGRWTSPRRPKGLAASLRPLLESKRQRLEHRLDPRCHRSWPTPIAWPRSSRTCRQRPKVHAARRRHRRRRPPPDGRRGRGADTGVGLSPGEQALLFTPFYRAQTGRLAARDGHRARARDHAAPRGAPRRADRRGERARDGLDV